MRSALIFILDRFTGSLKWTNSAKFVVEIDVTFFLSGKVLLLPLLLLLLLLIMLRVFVLWLEPNFVSSIVARWCDWAFCSYAKTSYIVKCIFMWAIHFHSRRFFLLHHLYFMLLSHFLSSLSYLNRFFFSIFRSYTTVYLYCRLELIRRMKKFSPLSHIPIGSFINNADGTCASVKVFGFLS